jgi:transposase
MTLGMLLMFLKCSERKLNGKSYKYYNLVESVRDNGKVKHNILFPLGNLSDEKAEIIRQVLKACGGKDIACTNKKLYQLSDIVVTKTTDFLNIYVLHQLWREWQLDSLFSDFRYVEKMVINRCINPLSKYRTAEWEDGELVDKLNAQPTPEPYGAYRELGRIDAIHNDIQKHLCSLMKERGMLDNETIIYDITSTYFERTKCTLAFRGYSRDHRPDKVQIVIALAITSQGYPFYWKVYDGNTPDVTTVEDFTNNIITLFGVTDFVFVFDRGMVSDNNIKYIEEKSYRFISAIDKNEISTSTPVNLEQFCGINEQNFLEHLHDFAEYDDSLWYREYLSDKRYIIGFSPKKYAEERTSREKRLNRFRQNIDDLNKNLSNAKKNRKKEPVQKILDAALKKSRVKRAVAINIEEISVESGKKSAQSYYISYSTDQNILNEIGLTDGLTCFCTNTASKDFTAEAIIRQYRDKNAVEEGFRELKGVMELRPVYLSKEERVRAHVTVCILSYLLYNTLEKKLSPKLGMSASDILAELTKCKSTTITAENSNEQRAVLTRFKQLQLSILELLGYSPKRVQGEFKKLTL